MGSAAHAAPSWSLYQAAPPADDPRSAVALAQQLRAARRQLHLAFFAACALLAWLLVQPGEAPPLTHRVSPCPRTLGLHC